MREQQSPPLAPPLAGVLRVLFLLAVAAVGVAVVVSGVTSFYEQPSADEFEGFGEFEENDERADYNRNVGLIVGLIGTATVAAGLLGLGSRFNPLRAGLLAGGVALVLGGVAVGQDGSDDWLSFLISVFAFLTLVGSAFWLDEGLPVEALFGGGPPLGGGGPPLGGGGPPLGGGGPPLGGGPQDLPPQTPEGGEHL